MLWIVIGSVSTTIDGLLGEMNSMTGGGVEETVPFTILSALPVRSLGTVFGGAIGKWGTIRIDVKNCSTINRRNMIDVGKPGGISSGSEEIGHSRASKGRDRRLRNSGGRVAECAVAVHEEGGSVLIFIIGATGIGGEEVEENVF